MVARLFARLRTKLPDKKALAEKTIKNVRATLGGSLASAKEWGEIPAIPDLPRVKVPESSWDFFTWEETERLLAACRDEEARALLMFAVHTGARAGEQLALSWGDIDWHNHLVVFRRSSTRRDRRTDQERAGAEGAAHRQARGGAAEDQAPS